MFRKRKDMKIFKFLVLLMPLLLFSCASKMDKIQNYYEMGEFDKAIDLTQTLDQEQHNAALLKASLLFDKGDFEAAHKQANLALTKDYNDQVFLGFAYFLRGRAAFRLVISNIDDEPRVKELESESIADLTKAVSLFENEPEELPIRLFLAGVYLSYRQFEEAEKIYSSIDADADCAMINHARALFALGKYDEVLAKFDELESKRALQPNELLLKALAAYGARKFEKFDISLDHLFSMIATLTIQEGENKS